MKESGVVFYYTQKWLVVKMIELFKFIAFLNRSNDQIWCLKTGFQVDPVGDLFLLDEPQKLRNEKWTSKNTQEDEPVRAFRLIIHKCIIHIGHIGICHKINYIGIFTWV